MERYTIFNNGNDENRNIQANLNYVKQLIETLQVEPEKYERLVADAEKNKEYILKQDKDIQLLDESIAVSFIVLNFFFIKYMGKWFMCSGNMNNSRGLIYKNISLVKV